MKWKCAAIAWIALGLAACATHPDKPAGQEIRIVQPDPAEQATEDAQVQRVVEGVRMIQQGHIQAAIDGPFDEVAGYYER